MTTIHPQPEELSAALEAADQIAAETRYRLQLARESYEAGFADGRVAAHREIDDAWQQAPKLRVGDGPGFAELELRRWGPDGRERAGDPLPSDRIRSQRRGVA